MTLRDYQTKSVDAVRENLKQGKRRPILVCPTGSGKSVMIGDIISKVNMNGKKVLWMVHRRNLVFQMRDTLKAFFGITPGIIMAGVEPDLDNNIQICTYQTYARRIQLSDLGNISFLMNPDVVIIDECHRSISKSYQDILKMYDGKIIIGTTATPARADGRGLGEVYDSIVDVTGVKELTEQGFLSPARYFAPNQVDLSGVKTAMGDYIVKELDGKMNTTKLVGDIVQNWLRLAENRKTIVFAVNVKHSKALCEEFLKNGIPAEHLDARSTDDERDLVFEKMQRGDITVITNVALYQEGLDVPDVSCIVMARPTKSMGLYRQCLGRGLRPAQGKQDCLILDHGNVIEEHGLLDWPIEWTLDGKERAWKKPSKEKTEKLVKCRACHHVFMGTKECPLCGTPVVSFGKKIATIEAELEEINAKEMKFSTGDKRQWFGMFRWQCREKGYSEGWAAHKYKEKFKVWPQGMNDVGCIPPTEEFRNYLRYLNIKWAKSKAKLKKDSEKQFDKGYSLIEKFQQAQGER